MVKDINYLIGMRVKHIRRTTPVNGIVLDQTQLSKLMGIKQGHLSNIESGQRALTPELARRFAEVYDADIADLLSGDPSFMKDTDEIRDAMRQAEEILSATMELVDGDEETCSNTFKEWLGSVGYKVIAANDQVLIKRPRKVIRATPTMLTALEKRAADMIEFELFRWEKLNRKKGG